MNDTRQLHLRWMVGMWRCEPNAFSGKRRVDSPIVDIYAFIRHGTGRPVSVDITAIVYGRSMPEFREHLALPLALTRISESEFVLESCSLSDSLPRSSYVLTGVPPATASDWCLK